MVGTWEVRNHIPESRRLAQYVHPGKFVAGKRVTPEALARQYRLAQDYPFVYTRGLRPKKSPQIETCIPSGSEGRRAIPGEQ